ncbi:hypothetical protein TNCV_3408831 [Trichonephila clavipes]|nr:hypothetical protein TNCV_3408831 [Trichonephila clavipes]
MEVSGSALIPPTFLGRQDGEGATSGYHVIHQKEVILRQWAEKSLQPCLSNSQYPKRSWESCNAQIGV